MVQRFEDWQSPDQKYSDRLAEAVVANDLGFTKDDLKWSRPWPIVLFISLVVWAVLIGLIFFLIKIANGNPIVDTPIAVFSERFQPFSNVSEPHHVVLLDPSLRKCIAGMSAPWGFHGLPY